MRSSRLSSARGSLTRHLLTGCLADGRTPGQDGYGVVAGNRLQLVVAGGFDLLVLREERRDEYDDRERDADVGHRLEPASSLVGQLAERRDDHDPDEADGDEHLPPERHELVVAKPRQGCAEP